MDNLILIVLLMIVLVGIFIFLPQILERRALRQIIQTFRREKATVSSRALTIEQLGIKKRRGSLSAMLFGKRDPKRKALLLLIQNEVVKLDRGKLFLLENKIVQMKKGK